MRIKPGVQITQVEPITWFLLGILEQAHIRLFGEAIVVTSLTDGNMHMPLSMHYKGFAADIRTAGMSTEDIGEYLSDVSEAL